MISRCKQVGLVHFNLMAPVPGVPPCADCGADVDDYYTEPNRCGGCAGRHIRAVRSGELHCPDPCCAPYEAKETR